MGIREYLQEGSAVSLKLNKAEAAAQKLFAYLTGLVDEIEKEAMQKEGRKIQIQGQKVKLKRVEKELNDHISNLKRFAQRT